MSRDVSASPHHLIMISARSGITTACGPVSGIDCASALARSNGGGLGRGDVKARLGTTFLSISDQKGASSVKTRHLWVVLIVYSAVNAVSAARSAQGSLISLKLIAKRVFSPFPAAKAPDSNLQERRRRPYGL